MGHLILEQHRRGPDRKKLAPVVRLLGAPVRVRSADRVDLPASRAASSCTGGRLARRWRTFCSARASRSRRCRWWLPTRRSRTGGSCAHPMSSSRSVASRRGPTGPPDHFGDERVGAARHAPRRPRRRRHGIGGRSRFDMAGKTRTANIAIDGHFSDSAYVASFIGMVPTDHPGLVVAVVVDQPHGSIYGGSVAARFSSRSSGGLCRTSAFRRASRPRAALAGPGVYVGPSWRRSTARRSSNSAPTSATDRPHRTVAPG